MMAPIMHEMRPVLSAHRAQRVVPTARTPAYILLLSLAFLFLPFTQALTIDVGFPLKIYELLFVASAGAFLFSREPLDFSAIGHMLKPLAFFWLVAVGSFFAAAYADTGHLGPNFRGGAVADGAMRVAYLLLNLGIFLMTTSRRHGSAARLLTLSWLVGSTISSLYLIYCAFSFLLVGDAIMLPGLERHQLGAIGPFTLSRSGTFEEGNFGGLYFLLSAVLAFQTRHFILACFAVTGLLLTQSTSAYFAFIALLGSYYLLSRRNLLFFIPYFIAACTAAFGLFVYFAEQGKFETTGSASGAVRFNEAMTGINMWLSSPVHGLGLGQYGYQYYRYVWDMSLAESLVSERHIASNIYVEILAELGLLGFLAIGLFWIRWMRALRSGRPYSNLLYASGIGLMIAFLAYPTFNIAFLWAYLGLALVLAPPLPEPKARSRSSVAERPKP